MESSRHNTLPIELSPGYLQSHHGDISMGLGLCQQLASFIHDIEIFLEVMHTG